MAVVVNPGLDRSERPKAVVTLQPDGEIFSGEKVTLTCEVRGHADIVDVEWMYNWYKDGVPLFANIENREYSFTAVESFSGQFTCSGQRKIDSQTSETSTAVTLTVSAHELCVSPPTTEKPKPILTSNREGDVLTGNSVTLYCTLKLQSAGWKFYWIKPTQSSETETETDSYIISSVSVTDGGQYRCRAGRGNPVYYTHYSDALWVIVTESPKAVMTIKPDRHVFRGETVTVRCEIQGGGDTEWTYSWYKNDYKLYREHKTQEFSLSSVRNEDSGNYTCRGWRSSDTQSSEISDAVTLTVSEKPKPILTSNREGDVLTGNSVTLYCTLKLQSAGWKFYWIKPTQSSETETESDSYIISSVRVSDGGQYRCRAGRGNPVYYTHYSDALWVNVTGCELEEKERFWSELDEVMESIPTGERVVIGADFNGHVGEGNTGDEEVMGKFGKREEHRVTYKSGGRRTQVDYILCRRRNLKEISDCKVVVGESVARQHRMVVCRMTLMVCKTKRSKIEKKTKWWKLKKEECCEEFRQKLRQALGGQVVLPDDWETTAEVIRETGRKVLGVSSGRRKEDKETWWWNEEVQDSIQRKRLAKKKWDMDRTEENRQEYKELECRVKSEVSKAKQKAYEELYTRLDTREGEKDLYRLARQRDRDGKDVQQVRVIKDRDGRVLTSEESVQRRWKEYFEELMNEENEREKRVEGVNSVEQKVDKIRKDEVRKALKRMKSGKAVGPDDIPVEYRDGQKELHCVFVDLEKAYDRVPREELWYCMRKSGVAEKYVRVVQDMYERSRTVVRCAVGQTEEFNVEVGLHQGSALSPFLFAIVMDQLSEEVRQESLWTMMFADDIVICSESREQVEENLERWRFALERRGMKVSRSKTEYMCVNERKGSGTVRLQGEEMKKVQEFKYLGSTVQSNGECGKEVKKRVQAGWNGWRKVSGVLCDQKISARIKGKVYRTVVRPAMLYGLETVLLRKRQESELKVAELKMFRFSLGVTRLDRIRNEYIRGTAHVGRLGDNVREARLRWFGHVQRREKKPKPILTSNHEGDVLTGNSVILYCTLKLQSAGWKFYWSKHTQISETETENIKIMKLNVS
ncbi:hypothetical protein QTP86_020982 [Hemibagrus guttatus]|nr:hypothetical protein QTP86_020982 [Hemibagrus guttatus]